MNKKRRLAVAFITTPRFRKKHKAEFKDFVVKDLWHPCQMFDVYSTGGTYRETTKILRNVRFGGQAARKIQASTGARIKSRADLKRQWREPIEKRLKKVDGGYPGMIRITNDLIVGRIDAVIHLMDWDDVAAKPDTMVLRRQANVHDVPIACDAVTARAMISAWKARKAGGVKDTELIKTGGREVPPDVQESDKQLQELIRKVGKRRNIGDRMIALIAHNGMKLEMCRFVAQHAKEIVEYDAVLSTGTTGRWIKRFLHACGRGKVEVDKVIPCLSGPLGGDVQIAWMVVQGICEKVIFFQDPMVSHAHATDIFLFEQALLYRKVKRALATNPGTAVEVLERRKT